MSRINGPGYPLETYMLYSLSLTLASFAHRANDTGFLPTTICPSLRGPHFQCATEGGGRQRKIPPSGSSSLLTA